MIQTPAIVIKETDYRDNDKMLTLFSPQLGRLDALSRGCKKTNGKLMASSQMFVCGEYLFNEKSGKLYHAGCEISHPFFGLRENYEKLYTAYLMVEITEKFILPEQEDERMYRILINSLFSLENDMNSPNLILAFFLVLFCDAAGHRPYAENCISCNTLGKSYYFVFESGGVMCADCAVKIGQEKRRISIESIAIIKQMLGQPSKAMREKIDIKIPDELIKILVHYLETITNSKFKSFQMINGVNLL